MVLNNLHIFLTSEVFQDVVFLFPLIWELFLDSLFKIGSAIKAVEGNIFLFNETTGIYRTKKLKFGRNNIPVHSNSRIWSFSVKINVEFLGDLGAYIFEFLYQHICIQFMFLIMFLSKNTGSHKWALS